jgi:hypothetical protein
MEPLPRHRDQCAATPEAQIGAELHGPRQERPGLGPPGQFQHLRHIVRPQPQRLAVGRGLDLVVDELDSLADQRDLPASRRRRPHARQRDESTGTSQRGDVRPVIGTRLVRQGEER